MKTDNLIYLQSTLERMSDEQLDELLHDELAKAKSNENSVRMILKILEDREKDIPVEMTPEVEKAWADYQKHMSKQSARPIRKVSRLLQVASIAVALLLVFMTIPQSAEAESIFDRLISWTDSIFALLNPEDAKPEQYVFHTDNPGLQEVYDAVVELGITEPVVPMWLPEEYELVELKNKENRIGKGVTAEFKTDDSTLVIAVDFYASNATSTYYKSESDAEAHEIEGEIHNVIKNNELWISVWINENVESTITVDCQEDIFYKILKSIYKMEDM